MFRSSSANPAKQNKLVKIFLRTPQIRLRDAMILAKYSYEEIKDKAFCRFLQRTLPGSSLKGLKAHIARVIPQPPDRTQRCQKRAIERTPPLVEGTSPNVNPVVNHALSPLPSPCRPCPLCHMLPSLVDRAHRVQLVRRVAQEPSVRGSNPSGARVQWNEGCAEPSVGGSNPYKME
jgi:hypothetical protein